jgi:hypothetical protein
LKVEKASVDPEAAGTIRYSFLPYSHSLVVSSVISAVVGIALGALLTPLAGLLFVVCSASHWLLDTVVHVGDLPVLGFGNDRKVGFGLWKHRRAAVAVEFGFYAILTLVFMPLVTAALLLILGLLFTLPFAGSSSASGKSMSIGAYAILSLVGFVVFALIAYLLIVFT